MFSWRQGRSGQTCHCPCSQHIKGTFLLCWEGVVEYGLQRPKKSELLGWQISISKNFPDEVRNSFCKKKRVHFFCDKKVCVKSIHNKKCVNRFHDKKVCVNHFTTKKVCVNRFHDIKVCINRFCEKEVCVNHFCNKKVCGNHFRDKKVCLICKLSHHPKYLKAVWKLLAYSRIFLDH